MLPTLEVLVCVEDLASQEGEEGIIIVDPRAVAVDLTAGMVDVVAAATKLTTQGAQPKVATKGRMSAASPDEEATAWRSVRFASEARCTCGGSRNLGLQRRRM
mmetsp:Transcript_22681/g.42594  ORF Transcript_22681/g.42594 Transcript_22681/m.42594 type:complete len:103 (-) Transcript_22681:1931-2239(-)